MHLGRWYSIWIAAMLAAASGCVFDPAGAEPGDGGPIVVPPDGADAEVPRDIDAGRADASLCPPGWVAGGTSCYLPVTATVSWTAARDACLANNAHLVIIDNGEENVRVAALAVDTAWWIGATDAETEGTWLWVDGSALVFVAWASGQPDNFFFVEDCAQQKPDGSWNDRNCTVNAAYVCELKLPSH
jgi:Lectin C-type domain